MIFINVKINKVLFNKIQIDGKNTFPSPDMIVDSSRKKKHGIYITYYKNKKDKSKFNRIISILG